MKPVHILLVEDNEGDILLTTEALEESRLPNTLAVVRNGKDALEYLHKRGPFAKEPTPGLVLLDVNLPLKNGHEVLESIKKDPTLCHIPVVMLTTSSSETDINRSYRNHVNCYVTKPAEIGDFLQSITKIEDFWLNMVALPTHANAG